MLEVKRKQLLKRKTKAEIAIEESDNTLWTTEKVNEWISNNKRGIKNTGKSPFLEDNYKYRRGGLEFEYTEEEKEEIRKCYESVEYFADKYCFAMTDDGVEKIKLYDYQRDVLKCFQQNRYTIYTASRQIGKCQLATTTVMTQKNNAVNLQSIYNLGKKQNFLCKIKTFLYKLLLKLDI